MLRTFAVALYNRDYVILSAFLTLCKTRIVETAGARYKGYRAPNIDNVAVINLGLRYANRDNARGIRKLALQEKYTDAT